MADTLADAFAALPGELALEAPAPVEAIDTQGRAIEIEHGRHLHLKVRPDAPVQLLFTGHMDTVFAADHPFQDTRWIDDGVVNGPGVADMKGGLAVMLAALDGDRNERRTGDARLRSRDQQRRRGRIAVFGPAAGARRCRENGPR